MKKFLCAVIALFLCISVIGFGCADAAVQSADVVTIEFDWSAMLTQAVVWLIGFVASALLALMVYVGKMYVVPIVIPWLKEKNLMEVATAAVRAAEAFFGRYTGEEKWQYAIKRLKSKGFDINADAVIEALKAAWKTLDIEQIAAGIKEADGGSDENSEILN